MKFRCFLCCVLGLSGLLNTSFAQLSNYHFKSYTAADGISSVYVNDIAQDTLGYMWFATSFGLNKFDGYHFTHYEHKEKDSTSIGNSYIRALYVDTQGTLWAGHAKGLSKYDPFTDKFSNYLDGIYVRNIHEDQAHNLWLATNKGLIKFNHKEVKPYQHKADDVHSLPTNNLLSVLVDAQGMVWAGTNGKGLCKLNPNDGSVETYANQADNPASLSHNNVLSLFEDNQGQLWAGTVDGLNRLDQSTQQFIRYGSEKYPIESNVIFDICQDPSGAIWFGSYSGLNKIDLNKREFLNFKEIDAASNSLSDNQIRSLFISKDKLLWIGAFNGLNSFDFSTVAFHHIKHTPDNEKSLSASFVWSIIKDHENNLWIGTKGGGLNVLDSNFQRVRNYRHVPNIPSSLSNDDIYSIYEDPDHQIWAGTDGGGLNLFNPQKKSFDNINHRSNTATSYASKFVKIIFKDDKGFYWVGTIRDGLKRYNPKTDEFVTFKPIANDTTSISDQRVYDIFQDTKGRLWIATNGGLNLYDYQTETFKRYIHLPGTAHTLNNNSVFSITEDKQQQLWLGTRDGLNLFNPETGLFKVYNEEQGLPNHTVYVALEDHKGNLWLSTNEGISKFNPVNESFINYDKEDGLQDNQFNTGAYFKDQAGLLYFGGINGFNVFHPDSIKNHTEAPNVVITDFLVFNQSVNISDSTLLNKPIDYTESITLSYDDYIFAFEFSALNFRQASKNQYAYRLFPFNDEWITTDHKDRKAVFTNVPHGTYQFQVKASNDDGYWNEEGTSIEVIILPPWWLTWWMKALYWILGIGIPLSIYFIRVASLKQRQKLLEEQVEERTAEVRKQNQTLVHQKEEIKTQAELLQAQNSKLLELDGFKQNMMSMIVHDLKNPLNGIIHVPETNPYDGILRVKKAGRHMLNMVLNILDVYKYDDSIMKVETAEEEFMMIAQEALEEVHFLATAKNITLHIQISEQLNVHAERALIIRVLVNLLTNAIKYTPQNGNVTLTALPDPDSEEALISVKDTGQGISKDQIEIIFQKFGQVQAKSSGNVRSTGLGLTFCKLAIEAHKGQIGVDSELGQGSSFWFTLPLGRMIEQKEYSSLLTRPINDQKAPLLSKEGKIIVNSYLERFKSLMVYEVSEIENILKEIDTDLEDVQTWKDRIQEAVYNMNDELYQELLLISS